MFITGFLLIIIIQSNPIVLKWIAPVN